MGLHGAVTCNTRQSTLAFDRALNDFSALNDQFGMIAVQLGQAILDLVNKKYETAFSIAKTSLNSAILYQFSIHSTIAHAIALKAAIESKNAQWYSQCPSNFHVALPDLFKPVWDEIMARSAQAMEQFDQDISNQIRVMTHEIESVSLDVTYPSVEITL